jgi:epoxide hydrolase-like predicted phosphatase
MPLKAVIFDLGGVLVRTVDLEPRQCLAARLGISPGELNHLVFDSDSARLATLGAITTEEHWQAVREALRLSPDEFTAVPQEFWGGDQLDLALVDFLRSLRPRFRTALLSNAWDDLRQVVEERWRIADAFDEIVISAEVGLAKPDARIFTLTLSRLGVLPSEAIFVDDFPENVEAARRVGLQTVLFQSPGQALFELKAMLDSWN